MPTFRLHLDAEGSIIAEIVALAQALGATPFVERLAETGDIAATTVDEESTDDERWKSLLSLLGDAQVDVLGQIKAHEQGITAEGIGRQLKRATMSITGSLGGGLRKNIPKAGFAHEDIIVTKRVGGVLTYYPGPVLLARDLP